MPTVPTILCVGTATLDMVLLADGFPPEDGRIEAGDVALVGGGNSANAAVAIARLGLPVEFCGAVGDDAAGELVVSQFEDAGVGTSLIERRAGAITAQSAIVVNRNTAARAIIHYPAPHPPQIPAGFSIVHLDKWGWASMPSGGLSSRVSVDEGNPIPGLNLAAVDWYAPTAALLARRFGTTDAVEAARLAREAGAGAVIATAGSSGSFALDHNGLWFAPALEGNVYSTLGAGDVFHGALVAALALGIGDMAEALAFANVTAGLACRALDGRTGVPTRAEVEELVPQLPQMPLTDAEISSRFEVSTTR